MSIITCKIVVCDGCGLEGAPGSTPAEARHIARSQGWDRRKDTFAVPAVFRDVCPSCAAGREQAPREGA